MFGVWDVFWRKCWAGNLCSQEEISKFMDFPLDLVSMQSISCIVPEGPPWTLNQHPFSHTPLPLLLLPTPTNVQNSHHQLSLILDVLGTPTMEEFYDITSRRSREYVRALPFRKKRTFESLYPRASPAAIDFLYKTLTCEFLDTLPPKQRTLCEYWSWNHYDSRPEIKIHSRRMSLPSIPRSLSWSRRWTKRRSSRTWFLWFRFEKRSNHQRWIETIVV